MEQMARTVATLPVGSRITDYISLGVIAKTFPVSKIHSVLAATGTASVRQRDLPASCGGLLCDRAGPLYAFVLSRGAALLARGCAMASRPVGDRQSGGQVGYFASPHAARLGTGASTA